MKTTLRCFFIFQTDWLSDTHDMPSFKVQSQVYQKPLMGSMSCLVAHNLVPRTFTLATLGTKLGCPGHPMKCTMVLWTQPSHGYLFLGQTELRGRFWGLVIIRCLVASTDVMISLVLAERAN